VLEEDLSRIRYAYATHTLRIHYAYATHTPRIRYLCVVEEDLSCGLMLEAAEERVRDLQHLHTSPYVRIRQHTSGSRQQKNMYVIWSTSIR